MTEDRSPELDKAAFICPICEAFADQSWVPLTSPTGSSYGTTASRCKSCNRASIWYHSRLVWPAGNSGEPPSPDMPEDVTTLYEEARSIMNLSPRAASALLRLALEALLNDVYPEDIKLNDKIGKAAADGLPDMVIKAMDVLRFNGNEAIHEINREDTAETAASLASILNLVVERLIGDPRRVAEMHAKLPPGVLAAIERRDGS